MKKNVKKILSLVLALAMVFSLSITAFAAGTATFEITIDGDPYITETITLGSDTTVYDVIEANKLDWEPDWSDVKDLTDSTTPGKWLNSLMGAGHEVVPETERQAYLPADVIVTAWSMSNPGYGLVSAEENADGKMEYTYAYVGIDWVYTINGVRPTAVVDGQTYELYMNKAVIPAGGVVKLDYGVQTEVWTTTIPISTVYPYC